MAANLGVFTGKTVDFFLGQSSSKTGVELSRELARPLANVIDGTCIQTYNVVKLGKQFGVEEQVGGCCKLVRNSVQEHFWAVIFVLLSRTLLRLDGHQTELEHIDTVTEENCLSSYVELAKHKADHKTVTYL